MGQIETSWEMDGQRPGSGLAGKRAQFYKLERIVVVDPQIALLAAVTQREAGQVNSGASIRTHNHKASMSATRSDKTCIILHKTRCSFVKTEMSLLRETGEQDTYNTETTQIRADNHKQAQSRKKHQIMKPSDLRVM